MVAPHYGCDVDGDSTVRIGILGCGNVGAALVQLVAENGDAIAARTGLRLEVVRVVVRDGAARVVVRRETYEDLLRLDA